MNEDSISRFVSSGLTPREDDREAITVVRLRHPFEDVAYPFRVEGLIIGLISEGEGSITIDLREHGLRKDTLLVIHPKNYVYQANGRGLVIDALVCSCEAVERVLKDIPELEPLMLHHRNVPVEQLSDSDGIIFKEYYRLLLKQYENAGANSCKRQKMMCLLESLLFELLDINQSLAEDEAHTKHRKEEIMSRFIMLVSDHFREQRQVTFYSDELQVSSKHLSAVVKELSGQTAGDWIETYVTAEAKILLRTTDMPIQEIAGYLNFTNQSVFGKYFKHQTGMSPSEFRKIEL